MRSGIPLGTRVTEARKCGLGRGFQAPEINSGDSPLGFPHEQLSSRYAKRYPLGQAGCLRLGFANRDKKGIL